jgi:hypothetical protein
MEVYQGLEYLYRDIDEGKVRHHLTQLQWLLYLYVIYFASTVQNKRELEWEEKRIFFCTSSCF